MTKPLKQYLPHLMLTAVIVIILILAAKEAALLRGAVRIGASIADEIERMPDWASLPPSETEGAGFGDRDPSEAEIEAQIESIAHLISTYDVRQIRAGFSIYMKRHGKRGDPEGFSTDTKLFVLTKYLFNLPEILPRDAWRGRGFEGIWVGLPRSDKGVSIRWPWSEDVNGEWHLTGRFLGYFGPPYEPLRAFDGYLANFGRRDQRVRRPTG
jgi:hypothetical protein